VVGARLGVAVGTDVGKVGVVLEHAYCPIPTDVIGCNEVLGFKRAALTNIVAKVPAFTADSSV